jgi:3-hydroxyisobutyrate dehydrogenase
MSGSAEGQTLAVLGTGLLGSAIAANLANHGFQVRVWNRTFAKAQGLERDGCVAFSELADAVADVDFVLTVLADGPTTVDVLLGAGQVLDTMQPPAMVVQVGTVGEATTAELAREIQARGFGFIDCPVSGSREPALAGELVMLASGNPDLRPAVQPLLDAMGRKTVWSDTVGDGTRLKLATNSWLGLSLQALSEVVALCRIMGVDPERFLEIIASGPLDMPYAQSRGRAMRDASFEPPAFALKLLVKDLDLALRSARERSQESSLLALTLARQTANDVCEAGYGDEDMTAIYRATQLGPELNRVAAPENDR